MERRGKCAVEELGRHVLVYVVLLVLLLAGATAGALLMECVMLGRC